MMDEKVLCPSCEHENAPEARFCEQCGTDMTGPETEAILEGMDLVCENCGETNVPEARFCIACGEPLVDVGGEEEPAEPAKKPRTRPEKREHKRLPAWARTLIMTLVFAILGAMLGLGFSYISPFLNTYMTYSPARMERAGQLAQEFVDRVYPTFADAEHTVSVDTDTDPNVYVVDFYTHDGEKSLALRILVDKYITRARALEYLEIDAPIPYGITTMIDADDGEQLQMVLSEGIRELLANPEIVLYDDFSFLDESRWESTVEVETDAEGQLEIEGESPFAADLMCLTDFTAGKAFILSLSFSSDADLELTLDSGEPQTADYFRAGVSRIGGEFSTSIWQGSQRVDVQAVSDLPIPADRWYGILGAVDDDGNVGFVFWDPEFPALAMAFQKEFGEAAAGRSWELRISVDSGTVRVDDYFELAFEGFR
jgi:hypothetical protein